MKQEIFNCPLVTIGVITYQSEKYVLETLDSIKRQTYKNIELIISDDGSTDTTIELCNNWIKKNKDYFVSVKLITSEKNTGTSANCNRILYESNGDWLKLIAGDDVFTSDAIAEYVDYVKDNPNVNALFSEVTDFSGNLIDNKFKYIPMPYEYVAFSKNVSARNQFDILKRIFIGMGPTFFVKTSVVKEVGGFDERFRLQEDYPLYIKLTKYGVKLYLLKKKLVCHRCYSDSVQYRKDTNDAIYSNHQIQCVKEYKYIYKYENLGWLWRFLMKYSLFIDNLIIDLGNNRKSILCRIFYSLKRFTDPFIWYARYLLIIDRFLAFKNKLFC